MKIAKLLGSTAVLGMVELGATTLPAYAGSPHFVDDSATATNNHNGTVTVSGKEAGLGNETQIHVNVTATALCINGGGNHPKAVNKQSVSAGADVPVQNGKADYSVLLGPAVFTPSCSPPMTVGWSNIVITDTTNNISTKVSGTF